MNYLAKFNIINSFLFNIPKSKQMKNLLFTLVLCLFTINLSAQSIEWQENFTFNSCNSIISTQPIILGQPTSDGGYMFSMLTDSINVCYDNLIVKTTATGSIQWQQDYGGDGCDGLRIMLETSDGGYLLGGTKKSSVGNISYDYWIVKINASGVLEWEQSYGGSSTENLTDIISTNDGGYLLAGYSESSDGNVGGNNGNDDYWIVKTNAFGTLQWEQNFGGSNADYLRSVVQTSDGGYVLGGLSSSSDGDVGNNNGNSDYWIVKINASGVLQWEQNYGGSNYESIANIIETSDGGLIIGGSSITSSGRDYWIVKINSFGTLQWQEYYGTSGSDSLTSVEEMNDGGLLLVGFDDMRIIKTNGFGVLEWEQTYGNYYTLSGTETNDGGILLIQHNGCDVSVTKINDGFVLCPSNVRVEAEAGDVYVDESCYGLILTAPDGSCFRVRVKSDTTLTVDPVICP